MKLLRFDRIEELDVPRLMGVYRESNLDNVPYFFPEEKDLERGLRGVEQGFCDYLRTDFFATPGNRYYVLEDDGRWASAIRLYPVPERPGAFYAEALETAPDLRRRGYGRKLMELLLFSLAQDGPFELTDSVHKQNEASLAFHRNVGFKVFQEDAVSALTGNVNPHSFGLCYRFEGRDRADGLCPECLSATYQVRFLTQGDISTVLALCAGNPLYYRHCPPPPSEDSIRVDMAALPPRKTLADKYYLGFFDGAELAAVLDLIPGFPKPEIAFWGFFMVDAARQGRGVGSALVCELCNALGRFGFRAVRLGWVRGNPQAEHFWKKNGFVETGVTYETNGYTVVLAERSLTQTHSTTDGGAR